MKYRVGRKQKRVILDENGYEVAICHKGKEEVAQQICDLLNEHGLVSKNESLQNVSNTLPDLVVKFRLEELEIKYDYLMEQFNKINDC